MSGEGVTFLGTILPTMSSFHLHPPLVLQNMLPYSIAVKDDVSV